MKESGEKDYQEAQKKGYIDEMHLLSGILSYLNAAVGFQVVQAVFLLLILLVVLFK